MCIRDSFNPEINLREVSAPGSYWENGHWVEIPAMSIKREYNFDQVGDKDMYLLQDVYKRQTRRCTKSCSPFWKS